MIWAAMSSAGVGPLCFLKSTVNAAIYQDILEHFVLLSANKLYVDADFIFQQDFPAPSFHNTFLYYRVLHNSVMETCLMCNESIYYMGFALSEMSDNNIDLFHHIQFLLDVPVY